MTLRTFAVASCVACVCALSGRAGADDSEGVGADLEAKLQIKVLTYDASLKERAGGRIVIGIVFRPESSASRGVESEMVPAFEKLAARFSAQGMTLKVVPIPLKAAGGLAGQLRAAGASMIYVTPGLDDVVGPISAAANELRASTATRSLSALHAGLAVAIVRKNERPAIVINLKAAKATGMNLSSDLLRAAEVVR